MIRPEQIVTLGLFMAVLALVWGLVVRNRRGLSVRVGAGRRMAVAEVIALSPTDRAVILRVDGAEFLVLRCKGGAPVVCPLGPAPEAAA
jgi:flagellar protein FliO/FliZ